MGGNGVEDDQCRRHAIANYFIVAMPNERNCASFLFD